MENRNIEYPAQAPQYMETRPPPLSATFHAQEFIPNHGYSNFSPPIQTRRDKERIQQLERQLDVSMNKQQSLAEDNKMLKTQVSNEGKKNRQIEEETDYEQIDSDTTEVKIEIIQKKGKGGEVVK